MKTILSIENVNKSFPGVQALYKINLQLDKGEVHAIVGENGAGKTTLMRILSGIIRMDSGNIVFDGKKIEFNSTREAQDSGISIIHQELNLPVNIGVHQNIFLGRIPTNKFGLVKWKQLYNQTRTILDKVGLKVRSDTIVKDLNVAEQQLVEIAKALSFNCKLIIMDEPTSALNKQEANNLFTIIKDLKNQGVTVIYISHRLDEIFSVSDRITVMRDGQIVSTVQTDKVTHEEIVEMMTGKSLGNYYSSSGITADTGSNEILLEVKNLSQKKILNDVSFKLYRGEILGIAGLLGSGRTELVKTIFGVNKKTNGEIILNRKRTEINQPLDAIKLGIAFLPEDRKSEGLLLNMNVGSNITLAILKALSFFGLIKKVEKEKITNTMVEALNIKTTGGKQLVRNLSGGNQQKVVIAKWIAMNPQVLLLDDPTRGVDVGAKKEIYGIIRNLARKGIGVLFISSEMPEVVGISDRILVMKDGKIIKELNKEEISEEKIMLLATGKDLAN
jgi:ABC-type sugar transport system ATPase subunit